MVLIACIVTGGAFVLGFKLGELFTLRHHLKEVEKEVDKLVASEVGDEIERLHRAAAKKSRKKHYQEFYSNQN